MPIGVRYTDRRIYTSTSSSTQPIYVWTGAVTGSSSTIVQTSGLTVTPWPVYPLIRPERHPWSTWVAPTYPQRNVRLATPTVEVPPIRVQQPELPAVRARALLDSVLSTEQKADLEQHGYFHVIGSRGNRYRIRAAGTNGNVDWVDDNGQVLGRLCAHPNAHLPEHDHYLAQMLALQHNEDEFVRIANVHSGRRPSLASAAA